MGPKKGDILVIKLLDLSLNSRCDIINNYLNSVKCLKKSVCLPLNGNAGYGPNTLGVRKIADGNYYYINNCNLFYIFGNKYAIIIIDCNLLTIKFYTFNGIRHWNIRDILNPNDVISDLIEECSFENEYEFNDKFQKFLRLLFSTTPCH